MDGDFCTGYNKGRKKGIFREQIQAIRNQLYENRNN